MSKFEITGGAKLAGEVTIQGSKNASFAVMAACLLTPEKCRIANVPDIEDVRSFMKIMQHLGAEVKFKNNSLTVNPENLSNKSIPEDLMGLLRGSILFAGALLARFGRAEFSLPGGDSIGRRPIDVHLDGFKKLGAETTEEKDKIFVSASQLSGGKITLNVSSVTGTENLILASVLAKGETEIRIAATEPHVQDLCRFLVKMGADISGIGTPNLRIKGVKKLKGADFMLDGDEIDTVTMMAAVAATKGEALIKNVNLNSLDAPLALFEKMNVNFMADQKTGRRAGSIRVLPPDDKYRGVQIITGVYPQLLTDHQPLFGVLATQAEGETSIHDWIYEGRQGYLRALADMGARVEFDDVHRARVYGPVQLRGAEMKTPDIRAGASLLIAALVATGRSVIYNAEIIDRGYEKLDKRLNELGAKIRRLE